MLQLFQGEIVDQPLAEHAVQGPAQRHVPFATLFRGALFKPLLFIGREIDGADPLSLLTVGHPFQFAQISLQSHADLLVFGGIEHLNKGAGTKAGAALLQCFAVHHPRFFGRHCIERSGQSRS